MMSEELSAMSAAPRQRDAQVVAVTVLARALADQRQQAQRLLDTADAAKVDSARPPRHNQVDAWA